MTFYTPSTGNNLRVVAHQNKGLLNIMTMHAELVEMCHVILVFCTSSIASTDNKSCSFIS